MEQKFTWKTLDNELNAKHPCLCIKAYFRLAIEVHSHIHRSACLCDRSRCKSFNSEK